MIIPITHFTPDPPPELEGRPMEDGVDDEGLGLCCVGEDVSADSVTREGLGGWFSVGWLSAVAFAFSRSLLMSETKSSNPEKPFPFLESVISLFLFLLFVGHETDSTRRWAIFAPGSSVFESA